MSREQPPTVAESSPIPTNGVAMTEHAAVIANGWAGDLTDPELSRAVAAWFGTASTVLDVLERRPEMTTQGLWSRKRGPNE
jgi:hypothetical protein